jgi:hypothetical protein
METAAQTKVEAAAGDQQAVQKLARGQIYKPAHVAQPTVEPAQPSAQPANGKLDAKA